MLNLVNRRVNAINPAALIKSLAIEEKLCNTAYLIAYRSLSYCAIIWVLQNSTVANKHCCEALF